MRKKILTGILGFALFLVASVIILMVYVMLVSKTSPPDVAATGEVPVTEIDTGLFVTGNNWFRKSESGLYELYAEGAAFERGVAIGSLTKELLQYQEKVFNDQIRKMIPSEPYLHVLKYFVGWFNRDLDEYVPEEYKLEIYGLSQASSHDYDNIATPYQRILNYHAAHDIGHALQNMSLVGCTSVATWGMYSEDSLLTIGRNFDFYAGEEFARSKIVAFYRPDHGHPFMMLTFGGMIGVLSGMNAEGLTVTINAAKSEIPSAAATPVSLVAREILQYASTIEEAYAIADKRKMFVAESFLIGSAKDGRAAIIEKSNGTIGLYDPGTGRLVCTNHFQSSALSPTSLNLAHMKQSASAYRYARVSELLERDSLNNARKTVSILRDQQGLHDTDIGLGNEKSINQLVAHHSIVFQPEKKIVWVSTSPWQLGKFVCYDLNKVFGLRMTSNTEICEKELEIAPDPFLMTPAYQAFVKMSKYRFPFSPKDDLDPDSIVRWNPNSYYAHMIAADHLFRSGNYKEARRAYADALQKEVATDAEKEYILKNMKACEKALP